MKLLVVSSYPKKGFTYQEETVGVASYTKNTLVNIKRKNPSIEIEVAAEIFDERCSYEEEGVVVKRVWKRGSVLSLFNLFFRIVSSKNKVLLFPFEIYMFGGLIYSALGVFLISFTSLLGKKSIIVLHQVVFDVSSFEKSKLKTWLSKLFSKVFYTFVRLSFNEIVVFEEGLKEKLGSKVVVIPHAVERPDIKSKSEARSELGLDLEKTYVLYHGFLSPYKGILDVVKGWNTNSKKKLLVVGGPNPNHVGEPDYDSYIKDLENSAGEKNILITGFVSNDIKDLYFMASDVLILPYREFISSSGPLSHAFSYELPVLLSNSLEPYFNSKDFRESLSKSGLNKNNLIFSSVNELESKIDYMEENRSKFELFSKLMGDSRSWELISSEYINLIEKLYV